MVDVPGEQRIGERAEPHEAPADGLARQVKWGDAAGHDDVGHIRAGAVQKSRGRCHAPYIGISAVEVNLWDASYARPAGRRDLPKCQMSRSKRLNRRFNMPQKDT